MSLYCETDMQDAVQSGHLLSPFICAHEQAVRIKYQSNSRDTEESFKPILLTIPHVPKIIVNLNRAGLLDVA